MSHLPSNPSESFKKLNPHIYGNGSPVQADPSRVHTTVKQRSPRKALDKADSRKAESRPRFEIVFTVHAVRVPDYDNPHCKIAQDLLVRSGILHGDDWRVLQGRVITTKAYSQDQEKTEICITPLSEKHTSISDKN
jgi:hypothetical protein